MPHLTRSFSIWNFSIVNCQDYAKPRTRRGIALSRASLPRRPTCKATHPPTLSHIGAGHVGSEVGQGGRSETTVHPHRAWAVCSHCSERQALDRRTLSGTAPRSLGTGNLCHQADAPTLCCAGTTALLWSGEKCVYFRSYGAVSRRPVAC